MTEELGVQVGRKTFIKGEKMPQERESLLKVCCIASMGESGPVVHIFPPGITTVTVGEDGSCKITNQCTATLLRPLGAMELTMGLNAYRRYYETMRNSDTECLKPHRDELAAMYEQVMRAAEERTRRMRMEYVIL